MVIVDTSNEIAGDGDIPHPGIGARAAHAGAARPSLQHDVMIEAVENHMPEVIVIDEIGTELEAAAARTIAERGVQLVGTAHGNTLENLMLNPTLSDLIGGIQTVTLGDEEARRRGTQKTVLERKAPPTFDVVVEIQDWDRVAVHDDVAETVDAMLRGDAVPPELRWRDEGGVHRTQARPRPVAQQRVGQRSASAARSSARAAPGGASNRAGGRPGRDRRRRGSRASGPPDRASGPVAAVAGARAAGRAGTDRAPGGPAEGPANGGPGRAAWWAARRSARRRMSSRPARSPIAVPSSAAPRRPPNRERATPGSSTASASGASRPGGRSSRCTPTRARPPCRRRGGGGRPRRRGGGHRAATARPPRRASMAPRRRPTRASCPRCTCCPSASAASASSRRSGSCSCRSWWPARSTMPTSSSRSRSQYRQKPAALREAEERTLPIYVLKSNTILQMEACLTSLYALQADPREAAMRETEEAIGLVMRDAKPIELSPQNAYIRRLQHQMAERANLVSRSRGREPFRRRPPLPRPGACLALIRAGQPAGGARASRSR